MQNVSKTMLLLIIHKNYILNGQYYIEYVTKLTFLFFYHYFIILKFMFSKVNWSFKKQANKKNPQKARQPGEGLESGRAMGLPAGHLQQ